MNQILLLEFMLLGIILGMNIFIFSTIYPIIYMIDCCELERNIALGLMWIVPVASVLLMYHLVSSIRQDLKEKKHE